VRWIGLSNGYKVDEFYFKDDSSLIFIHTTFWRYEYDNKADIFLYDKTVNIFSGRYWFWNGRLVDTQQKGQKPSTDDIKKQEKEFLSDAENYSMLLYKKLNLSKKK
jgi:hypothetical protein